MKGWARRIRGALGMAAAWAAAWCPFGVLWGLGDWLLTRDGTPLTSVVVTSTVLFTGAGFACGALFSVVLNRIDGRLRFDQLSGRRFVAWGLGGGVLLAIPLVLSNGVVQLSVNDLLALVALPLLGAASAAGSLKLARMPDQQTLSAGVDEPADAHIEETPTAELLG